MQELIVPGVIAAYLTKDMLQKILGPTAEYLGEELEKWAKSRIKNVQKILLNAKKKLGPRLDSPGRVSPKVLKAVINEGSYAEDPIAVEYFGGVLASSKTEFDRDDRGARLVKIVDNLSAYQIRTHYLVYSTMAHIFSNSKMNLALNTNRAKMQIFITFNDYLKSMEFTQRELNNLQLLPHIFNGLLSDNLIEGSFSYGDKKHLQKTAKNVPGGGLICSPSALGIELFLWAFGYGDKSLDYFLSGELEAQIPNLPTHLPGSIATKQPANPSG